MIVLLLALDSTRGENSLPGKFQEFRICTKHGKTIFSKCIAERFPPGSNYHELEIFLLEKKGFRKVSVKPAENGAEFIFRWRSSISMVKYVVTVVGKYDGNFGILEVSVN